MEMIVPIPQVHMPIQQLVSDRDAKAIVKVLREQALRGDAPSAAVLLMLPRPGMVVPPILPMC